VDGRDYELHLARLSERNRIARDIHDSVGHVLSASLLQTGALLATCRDVEMAGRLRSLKETLTAGMEAVRESVDDLHDESVDLYAEFRGLCDGFDFCAIALVYDMDTQPDRTVKYTLLSVAREALSNVMRHSDATQVTVRATEHPAFYQLAVRDNGSRKERHSGGIGLMSIEQRVGAAGGIVNIGYQNGFSVFVSIPKAGREEKKP
jgi:signal transduction histidine kinase